MKKSKHFGRRIIIAGVVAALISVAAFYLSDRLYKPHFIHYTAFGIDIPANYSIHGIDVSRYQQRISWPDVKAMNVQNVHIGFAFLKATEGSDMADEQYRNNVAAAKKAGMITPIYTQKSGSLPINKTASPSVIMMATVKA